MLGLVLGVALSGVFGGDPSAGDGPANAPPAKVTAADTGTDPKAAAAEVVTGGLRQLQVTISEPDWQVLQDARDRALKEGIIVQDDRELVPVTLAFGGQRATGRVRLKGDWVDHVSTDQWSLRFELDTALQEIVTLVEFCYQLCGSDEWEALHGRAVRMVSLFRDMTAQSPLCDTLTSLMRSVAEVCDAAGSNAPTRSPLPAPAHFSAWRLAGTHICRTHQQP